VADLAYDGRDRLVRRLGRGKSRVTTFLERYPVLAQVVMLGLISAVSVTGMFAVVVFERRKRRGVK
jgi:hypothetical protein